VSEGTSHGGPAGPRAHFALTWSLAWSGHFRGQNWGRHVRARALSPSAGMPCGGRHCSCSPLWGLPLGQWFAGTAAACEWVSRRPAVQMSGDSHLARAAIALHCRASSSRLGRP